MNNILAIEWLKIRRYRTFWVLVGLFAVLLALWNYQISRNQVQMGADTMNVLSNTYNFPDVWSNLGWWGGVFVLFLSILVITLTCNEFTFKTHRQNVIDGWSRLDFYHAKVALVATVCIVTTIYVFLLGLLFGFSNGGTMKGMVDGIEKMGYFFILLLNYLGASLFIALWLRRSGLSIALFLFYALIIEYSIAAAINHYSNSKYGNLMPLQCSDELLPFPLVKMAANMMSSKPAIPDYVYVLVSCGWIIIYYFAGRRLILKRDL
jgi:hypothetical protein